MRKVLLATTALVAMGGVSAASADITVSGSASYNYITNSGSGSQGTGGPAKAESRDMSTTTDANISMSTSLDNGMSMSGLISLDETGVDDSGWSITGDFGTLAFGKSANDGFGTTATGLTADEGNTFSTTDGAATPAALTASPYKTVHNDFVPHSDVSITLPAVSGFTSVVPDSRNAFCKDSSAVSTLCSRDSERFSASSARSSAAYSCVKRR